ncbi:hypothetical protein [Streptomyces sp. NPDC020983]|uniref:hypothetical protein n=1 Tax=Streptomyces sp. NPDC020983 TaxID=3365106 RepID=UPI00379EC21F
MTTATPPPREEDDEPSAVPEAVWEEFAGDTFGAIRATAPKEPSARARMVTERLRREDEAAAERERRDRRRWGRGRRRPQEPAGWRTGPAWREMRRDGRRSWRDRLRAGLVVVVVAVLALIAVNPSGARALVRGHWHSSGSHDNASGAGQDPAGSTPLPPETAPPSAPPPAVDPGIPTVSHPFAGSPALGWADGAAGIQPPHATAVGGVTAGQVAAALEETRAYLVAADLDPAALRGGFPAAALRVIDPANGEPAVMKAALRSPSRTKDPTVWFTRYDPQEVRPVGTVVKVRGRMTFAAADHGAVRVHADYSFVYAFTRTGDPNGPVTRLVARRVVDTEWFPRSARGKVQLVKVGASFGGAGCGPYDGFLHPLPGTAPGVTPSGPAIDPYDRSRPLSNERTCGVASRV